MYIRYYDKDSVIPSFIQFFVHRVFNDIINQKIPHDPPSSDQSPYPLSRNCHPERSEGSYIIVCQLLSRLQLHTLRCLTSFGMTVHLRERVGKKRRAAVFIKFKKHSSHLWLAVSFPPTIPQPVIPNAVRNLILLYASYLRMLSLIRARGILSSQS